MNQENKWPEWPKGTNRLGHESDDQAINRAIVAWFDIWEQAKLQHERAHALTMMRAWRAKRKNYPPPVKKEKNDASKPQSDS